MQKYAKLNTFHLKIIAMVTMFIDHFGHILIDIDKNEPLYLTFRIIGRIAFVLYAFFAYQGTMKSKNVNKYFLRLLIMLVATSLILFFINQQYSFDIGGENIFITLLAGATLVYYLKEKNYKNLYYLIPTIYVIISFCLNFFGVYSLPTYIQPYYSLFGVLLILIFYLAKVIADKYLIKQNIDLEETTITTVYNYSYVFALVLINTVFYLLTFSNKEIGFIPFQSWSIIGAIPLLLYNGALGHSSKVFKYIYYLFYPVHIALLFAISLLL